MKILRRLLITLVIVVAVVALGDRVANALVERRIADEVANTAAANGAYSDQEPDVKIHGWPFLTQAWTGEFEQIDITLQDVGSNGLTFPSLEMVAHDVDADWRELRNGGDAVASTLDVSGSVSVDSIEAIVAEQTGYDLQIDEDGTASLTGSQEFLGVQVDLEATGKFAFADNTLTFTPDAVESLTENLPPQVQPLVDQAAGEFASTVALPELPYGIQLSEIRFEGDVVTVSGTAEDVVLT
ncbi:DUF2993 domain-containing protein [Glycomyces algeriensis]|uniref:DUF2993 family protein n=1 Tax=Glycomyces algeriensis TaxID=256037 RepID=A0A9W6LEF0_9ACTN|nr:DUF2993 domain-containing protein [Glycomyces algeriensis]MDA1367488.1 DUF2993 domain-containing protein [Glycomyces algeriensis]MDR7353149.1 hypothetical protein [Glycomyces algeriensis]GLI40842.1 hypothetical protein GALLR39Z86_06920 [Glycomyces algeriensis]